MKIAIGLPRKRINAGELKLLSDGGSVLFVAPCLGKADNQRAAREGNPTRDPLKPWGDTPLGEYLPARVEHLDPPHEHMGALVIPLKGIDGDALCAMRERTDLFIHGGRGDRSLIPTFGCVRVLDRDMARLAALLGGEQAAISIAEMPDPPPAKQQEPSA